MPGASTGANSAITSTKARKLSPISALGLARNSRSERFSPERTAAAGADSVFLCRTGARYFYNSQVATLSCINILTSCIAIQMGSGFDEILANEQDVMDFLDSFNYAEKAEN